jgi:Tfp pilus assembly protein PilF
MKRKKTPPSSPKKKNARRRGDFWSRVSSRTVCAVLLLLVFAAFGSTVRYGFINLDDGNHICGNAMVNHGVTVKGIVWAFTKSNVANWHPATSLSHMLVCQFFGLNASWHHLTNLLLHAGGTILLFLVLRQMTGQMWPSAFVAALFAVHPLRVESVVWITERKDVLSGVFFMLTLWAYVRYVRQPFSFARYAIVAVFLAMGLMSKAMIVTTPCVLLLLDYWPLRRTDSVTRRILEKIPLLAISVAASLVTFWVQGEAIGVNQHYSLSWRIGNSLITYVTYLSHFFYPINFAVVYPRLGIPLPPWQVIGAAAILTSITAGVVVAYKKYPYLLVGWFWYLGMLLPVIGLVQVGMTAVSDRFTYLPQIGIGIMLTWGAADLMHSWSQRRQIGGIASAAILGILIVLTWHAASFWCDSETLWKHTLAHTPPNSMAHYCLGLALADENNHFAAKEQFEKSLAIRSDVAEVHGIFGVTLLRLGKFDDALREYRTALKLAPDSAVTKNNLAWLLATCPKASLRNGAEAVELALQAVQATAEPNPGVLDSLAAAYAEAGQFDRAVQTARDAETLAVLQNESALAKDIQGRIALYEARKPFRETPPPTAGVQPTPVQ